MMARCGFTSAKIDLLNYDTHGDGGGQSISYEKGRGVPGDEGELVAPSTATTAGSGATAATPTSP